jgi:predicted RND superfamily exporter protein
MVYMMGEQRLMAALARFVSRSHKIVLAVGIVLFVLSIFSARTIVVETEIKDLLPEDDPKVSMYNEINEQFFGGTSLIITVEGDEKAEMIRAAEAFVAEMRASPDVMDRVRAINLKLDRRFVTDWGLMLQEKRDLEKTARAFSQLNLLPFITALNDSFEETYYGETAEEELVTNRQENEVVDMLTQVESLVKLLRTYLEDPEQVPVQRAGRHLAEAFVYGDLYGFSHDGSMLLFNVTPNFDVVDIKAINVLMKEVKQITSRVQSSFPELRVGYSGDVAVQADEQDALNFDMLVPALVALVVILVLFIFSFNQLRSILFILLTLVMGIVFNYGLLGITLGKINMLTSIMAVLLIGLGVDYGIQVVTNFTTFRADGFTPQQALEKTYTQAGMGILLAALTTALAFFVMAATGTKAFAQFGVVMGTGILTCFLAVIFILPALLLWFGKKDVSESFMPQINYDFLPRLGGLSSRHRRSTLFFATVLTAGLLAAALGLCTMDFDLMNMEPQDMPSIIQYRRIMEKYDLTPFHSMVVMGSVKEARELTAVLEKEHLVAEVRSISYFLPPVSKQDARLAEIRKIREMPPRFQDMVYGTAEVAALAEEIQRLEWNIIEIGDLSVAGLGEENKIFKKRNRMIHEVLGADIGAPGEEIFQQLIDLLESDPDLYGNRLTHLDFYFSREMDRLVSAMARVNRRMTVSDLPEDIARGMLDEKGEKNLVMIYPKPGIFESKQSLERFNDALEKISPSITGSTQISVTWLEEVITSSRRAALYIITAVLLFLLLTFRSLRYTLYAAAPLLLGMIWMMGIYSLFGLKINMLNIAVIPLVIGMGIDFGIHLAHRYSMEQEIETVYRYTGKGVFLSAVTTMIGFGSLGLIGSFPSIASMGSILFFGIASCLATALFVLPALLGFDNRNKASARTVEKESAGGGEKRKREQGIERGG